MADLRRFNSTSQLIRFVLKRSDTGQGLTGLANNSNGLLISTIIDVEAVPVTYSGNNIEGIATLGTFETPTANKCRFKELDANNHKGVYEFQFPNTRFNVANATHLIVSVTGAANMLDTDYEIQFDGPIGGGNEVFESTLTLKNMIRCMFSALCGKSAGGNTSTLTFRDYNDSKNRISATVDSSGNRTAITVDGS